MYGYLSYLLVMSWYYLTFSECKIITDRLIGQPDSRLRHHTRPQQVPALMGHFVEEIAVGSEHTLALTSSGEVFAWGSNGDGQLGLGHTGAVREPQLVSTLSNKGIRQVRNIKENILLGTGNKKNQA